MRARIALAAVALFGLDNAACSAASGTGDGGGVPHDAPSADHAIGADAALDVVLSPDVTVAPDVVGTDTGTTGDSSNRGDGGSEGGDGGRTGTIDADGGTVDRLHFAVFGDIRPPLPDEVSSYPTAIVTQVMDGITSQAAQFAIGTGDYMNENFCSSCATQMIDQLQMAETHFTNPIFHAMGNHECLTVTSVNCPNENESVALTTYRSRLIPGRPHTYFDWTIHTSMGDAHFIATAPNAWTTAQRDWLGTQLAVPARYTFVIAHEPPSGPGPGTTAIEAQIAARAGGVTMRLYGHLHSYMHPLPNATVTGNAGAPLDGASDYYGFVVVDQRADGNLVVNAYDLGEPAMVRDTFVLTPEGMLSP